MTTHISYSTAKKLKVLLGESAPEPIPIFQGQWAWIEDDNPRMYEIYHAKGWSMGIYGKNSYWSYQLHDLLSKPFCEAFAKNLDEDNWPIAKDDPEEVSKRIWAEYYDGGLPAVEKALCEMMEAK